MFRNFYLVKNHKTASNSATTEAIEKISTDLESLVFRIFLNVCLAKFENNQILLNKICNRFLLTTFKLFTGQKSLIISMLARLRLRLLEAYFTIIVQESVNYHLQSSFTMVMCL